MSLINGIFSLHDHVTTSQIIKKNVLGTNFVGKNHHSDGYDKLCSEIVVMLGHRAWPAGSIAPSTLSRLIKILSHMV